MKEAQDNKEHGLSWKRIKKNKINKREKKKSETVL